MKGDAGFSTDEVYRYWLSRSWRPFGLLPENPLVVCGANPSTADATKNDPTITREIGFAKEWGHDGLIKINAFAFRATDPDDLYKTVADPVGPENDEAIRRNARGRRVLCAWGKIGRYLKRDERVVELLLEVGAELLCLGTNKDGTPKHPLYLKKTAKPVPYTGVCHGRN